MDVKPGDRVICISKYELITGTVVTVADDHIAVECLGEQIKIDQSYKVQKMDERRKL